MALDHGLYKVLFPGKDKIPKIIESRHVTIHKFTFPGVPSFLKIMESEAKSDRSTDSVDLDIDRDLDSNGFLEVSVEDVSLDNVSAHNDNNVHVDDDENGYVPILEHLEEHSDNERMEAMLMPVIMTWKMTLKMLMLQFLNRPRQQTTKTKVVIYPGIVASPQHGIWPHLLSAKGMSQ